MAQPQVKLRVNENYGKLSLEKVADIIKEQSKKERAAAFEIGKWFKYVKENDLAHGQFTNWVESLGYTARTAQRYMQVYERFGEIDGAFNLPVSKLFEMLTLPHEVEAKRFLSDKHVVPNTGQQKNVVEMTRDELRSVIRETKGTGERPTKTTPVSGFETKEIDPIIEKAIISLRNIQPLCMGLIKSKKITIDEAIKVGELTNLGQKNFAELMDKYGQLKSWCFDNWDDLARLLNIDISIEIFKVIDKINSNISFIHVALFTVNPTTKAVFEGKLNEVYNEANDILSRITDGEIDSLEGIDLLNKVKTKLDGLYDEIGRTKTTGYSSNDDDDFYDDENYSSTVSKKGNYLEILGVKNDATKDEVKKRYRQLAKSLHPDVGGSEYLFKLINEAHEALTK